MDKKEAGRKIEEFFNKKHGREEVRKIKKLAESFQIKLGGKRKLFCNQCYSMNLKVLGVKKGIKRVICKDCDCISRWKV